jgi:hypothetical protein
MKHSGIVKNYAQISILNFALSRSFKRLCHHVLVEALRKKKEQFTQDLLSKPIQKVQNLYAFLKVFSIEFCTANLRWLAKKTPDNHWTITV